ncbi:MAG TPA: hypothetical protein DSN98_06720 [Thermoplasmata archaeon]|nr:MAG TPA: hypothetical protein DSN98_06720 [Thermoplasmata archaeon]
MSEYLSEYISQGTGTSGTNSVKVIAKFANGAESVVYMGSIGYIFRFNELTNNGVFVKIFAFSKLNPKTEFLKKKCSTK